MFCSFFPKSPWFFVSALLWAVLLIAIWMGIISPALSLNVNSEGEPLGIYRLISFSMGAFCLYFLLGSIFFWGFWQIVRPQKYSLWSVLGSCLILFSIYYTVECNVALNDWVGDYFNLIQDALTKPDSISEKNLYFSFGPFFIIGLAYTVASAFKTFFISHYIFRWRMAMNAYYRKNWSIIREVEGAAQRVQDDTMRFASMLENIGTGFIEALLTLIAFLPVLSALSKEVGFLPLIGNMPNGLVYVAIIWSVLGTVYTMFLGRKLPKLEYNNQKVEAAYRKELVRGEDDPNHAAPATLKTLFHDVKKNYYLIYRRYLFFNIGTGLYSQLDSFLTFIILTPAVAVGKISFGVFTQVSNVFGQVSSAFQFLIRSWSDVIALISIYRRLRELDKVIEQRSAFNDETLAKV